MEWFVYLKYRYPVYIQAPWREVIRKVNYKLFFRAYEGKKELEENETMTKGNEVSNMIWNGKKMVIIYSPSHFTCKTRAIGKGT